MKKQELFELFECCIKRLESTEFFKEFRNSFRHYNIPHKKFENWGSVRNLKASLEKEFDLKENIENKEILKLIIKNIDVLKEVQRADYLERLKILEESFTTFICYFIDYLFEEKEKIIKENN